VTGERRHRAVNRQNAASHITEPIEEELDPFELSHLFQRGHFLLHQPRPVRETPAGRCPIGTGEERLGEAAETQKVTQFTRRRSRAEHRHVGDLAEGESA